MIPTKHLEELQAPQSADGPRSERRRALDDCAERVLDGPHCVTIGSFVVVTLIAAASSLALSNPSMFSFSGVVPAATAQCVDALGPSLPPPAVVPSGVEGFHAAWYGQSGYAMLCPGGRSTAVIAFYNSGTDTEIDSPAFY